MEKGKGVEANNNANNRGNKFEMAVHNSWANKASALPGTHDVEDGQRPPPSSSPIDGLTDDEYHQLLSLFREQQQSNEGNKSILANFADMCTSSHIPWVIDSGALEHMVGDKNLLNFTHAVSAHSPVKIADGILLPIIHVESINLSPDLKLDSVLCLPKFDCNFLSIAKSIRDLNCSVAFYPNPCTFQDLDSKRQIGAAKLCDGVYQLNIEGCDASWKIGRRYYTLAYANGSSFLLAFEA